METAKVNVLKIMSFIILAAFFGLPLNAQSVKDRDGKEYKTVRIGPKEWMAENLDVASFCNEDAIIEAKTAEEWAMAGMNGKPAWCYYENDNNNGARYGKLYNWFAITDPRGLAPKGWHSASNADWTALTKSQGGVDIAGTKMKSEKGWDTKGNGTNKSGFTGLPGGFRDEKGKFNEIDKLGQWWSVSTVIGDQTQVYSLMLRNSSVEVAYQKMVKGCGFSVRAVKD